ncbi:hypothetical protein FRB99_003702 [Tulasnella sp. 403]|nr:hypothetical protein FRB99_003702 [Tulasnella sp. 403]
MWLSNIALAAVALCSSLSVFAHPIERESAELMTNVVEPRLQRRDTGGCPPVRSLTIHPNPRGQHPSADFIVAAGVQDIPLRLWSLDDDVCMYFVPGGWPTNQEKIWVATAKDLTKYNGFAWNKEIGDLHNGNQLYHVENFQNRQWLLIRYTGGLVPIKETDEWQKFFANYDYTAPGALDKCRSFLGYIHHEVAIQASSFVKTKQKIILDLSYDSDIWFEKTDPKLQKLIFAGWDDDHVVERRTPLTPDEFTKLLGLLSRQIPASTTEYVNGDGKVVVQGVCYPAPAPAPEPAPASNRDNRKGQWVEGGRGLNRVPSGITLGQKGAPPCVAC